jgi:Uma2 family endonuclease
MATGTLLKLGPKHHGRALTLDEFWAADYQEGHQYELIDGKLYVSPVPNPPQNIVDQWIFTKILLYSREHPEVINYATNKGRVIVPGRPGATVPEPDLLAYRDFPLDQPFRTIRWQETHPILVGEVLSLDDPDKDLIRNVELYWQVPTIKEYWLFDTRQSADQPTLQVYRRSRFRWRMIEVGYGEPYTTKLLPGFELLVDPRK